jgi:hypothetical protein
LRVKSAKGLQLDKLCQEIESIIEKYKDYGATKIQRVPAAECVLVISNNLKLGTVLYRYDEFIITKDQSLLIL